MASSFQKPVQTIPDDILKAVYVISLKTGSIPASPKELPDGAALAGSVSNKLYPFFGDVDAIQNADFASVDEAARAIQAVVQKIAYTPLFTFVELKAGSDACLQFLKPRCWIERGKVQRWSLPYSLKKLQDAKTDGACSSKNFTAWSSAFRHAGTACPPAEFPGIEDIDPWKLRWSSRDVARGDTKLEHGDAGHLLVTLEDALTQPSLVKLDAFFWSVSQQRFLDISIIYNLTVKGVPINANDKRSAPPELSLKQDIFARVMSKDFIKAAKRMLSLCILLQKDKDVFALRDIVVSDFGRASAIASDCETLRGVLDSPGVPHAKVLLELEGIKNRVGAVYGLKAKDEAKVLAACQAAMKAEVTPSGVRAMQAQLEHVEAFLESWYQGATEAALKQAKYLPLPAWALP